MEILLKIKKATTDFISNDFLSLAMSYSHRGKPPTTIGAKELNFRVRYGNGCDLFAIITRLVLCIVERLFSQNWITALKAFLLVKSSID